jgi:uncharacterized protein
MNRAYNHGSQGDFLANITSKAPEKKPSAAPQGTGDQLREAARTGNIEAVKAIIDKWAGDSVLDEGDSIGTTALHTAASNGHKQIVEILLAAGADKNAQNIYGQKPFARAQTSAIRELLRDAPVEQNGSCSVM